MEKFINYAIVTLLVPVVIFGVLYGLGSFTAGNSNPAEWTEDSRGILVFIWFFAALFATIAALCGLEALMKEDEKG